METLAIIGSVIGVSWLQTQLLNKRIDGLDKSLNKRIDDLKDESAKAHAGIGDRIETMNGYFIQHLDGHPPRIR